MNYTKQNSNGREFEYFLLASIPAAVPLDSLNVWPGILCTRMHQIIRIICQYYTLNFIYKWKMYTEEYIKPDL